MLVILIVFTFIIQHVFQKANAEVGNVHSNTVPPWLRRDEKANQMQDASKSDTIGPSMETFQKHRKLL